MKKRKTNEQFIKEVYELIGDEYSIKTSYINAKTKIKIKHNICSFEYEVTPSDFLNGRRCPKCSGKIRKDTNYFQNELNNIFGENKYIIIGQYVNQKTKIKLRHDDCNFEFYASPTNLVRGHGCPLCSGKMLKNKEQFKEQIYNLVGNEYEVLEEYVNSKMKLTFKHNLCGNTYQVTPDGFINNNRRCPFCNQSKGEESIRLYLDKMNFKYIPQYRFNDCRNSNPLQFDFAVFNDENILLCLIEFDGEQHFKSKEHFGGEKYLKQVKLHDSIKNEYCKIHELKLIRIPYWDIDKIVENLEMVLI